MAQDDGAWQINVAEMPDGFDTYPWNEALSTRPRTSLSEGVEQLNAQMHENMGMPQDPKVSGNVLAKKLIV
jgi:hypothetical protein